jgi:endonuclease/exonuclease/phosphatase family metal-dependent hydrolase
MTRPDRRIDYVLCGEGVTPRTAEVVMASGHPRPPSDHFGLLVELVLG